MFKTSIAEACHALREFGALRPAAAADLEVRGAQEFTSISNRAQKVGHLGGGTLIPPTGSAKGQTGMPSA
jgi:hypothetical protein